MYRYLDLHNYIIVARPVTFAYYYKLTAVDNLHTRHNLENHLKRAILRLEHNKSALDIQSLV